MSRRRGLNLPSLGDVDFVPRAPDLNSRPGIWGITTRTLVGETYYADGLTADDLVVGGAPLRWREEDNGTGVLYGRAYSEWGVPVAVARAVPLS